jgi:hypothetical protein
LGLEKRTEKYKIGKLKREQKEKLQKLIQEFEDIFAKDENDLGRTNLAKHSINTGDHEPIK